MPQFDWVLQLGIVGAALVLGLLLVCGAVPIWIAWLYHRRQMVKLRGTNEKQMKTMQNRIDMLEERCAKLEQRVTDAHCLLADEQRLLDRKLASILPDTIAPAADEPSESRRRSERGRVRD